MAAFSSLADLVKFYESGAQGYSATTPNSSSSGAYGFLNSTWRQYAAQSGFSTAQYPTALSAPPAVQDQVFQTMVSQRGLADYTCPGCDPPLANYVAQNPYVSGLPIFANSAGSSSGSPPLGFDIINPDPNAPVNAPSINPFTGSGVWNAIQGMFGGGTGAGAGAGGNPSVGGAVGSALGLPSASQITAWLLRGGLIILGIVLILGAIILLNKENALKAVKALS